MSDPQQREGVCGNCNEWIVDGKCPCGANGTFTTNEWLGRFAKRFAGTAGAGYPFSGSAGAGKTFSGSGGA